MSQSPESPLLRLAGPCYLLAALLVVIPFVDTAAGVLPPHGNNMFWRYGATGVFSRGLLEPSIGFTLAAFVAVGAGHAQIRRMLSIVCTLIGAGLVALVILFALDSLQMRKAVRPDLQANFNVANSLAAARFLAAAALAFALGLRLRHRKAKRASSANEPIVRKRDRVRATTPDQAAPENTIEAEREAPTAPAAGSAPLL